MRNLLNKLVRLCQRIRALCGPRQTGLHTAVNGWPKHIIYGISRRGALLSDIGPALK